ncbi:hypothetical protein VTJ83DRAFT_4771 [Remersonia thermophila]|uniref:PAS domain-containing protein n=1 Tax=Remersonia thermophila TaxID=72144 RepID=A0ABR4DCX8_9PEZI
MDPRDQTFMTIHNLTANANILFASDSIYDILGYQPDEVKGKSAFEYFHPEEVPFARSIHSRGVLLDKAAVLHYARILSKSGQWISCECCFTVVHDVLVASTSIYYKGERSERRARDAPHIRRIFSSSPRDPRYQMLEHLSPKFRMLPMEREPRAALILNRFTRSLSIMYATDAVSQILGVRPDELLDKPFYECIQPNCLDEAERCLESAKANESIAYLRFWYKDPRVDPNETPEDDEEDDEDDDEDDDDDAAMDDAVGDDESSVGKSEGGVEDPMIKKEKGMGLDKGGDKAAPREDSGASERGRPRCNSPQTFELEAVVSCTSDGLVVVLRRARPPIPDPQPPVMPAPFNYENGLFAAPWGLQPIEPYIPPNLLYTFRPPFLPQYMPLRECVKAAGGLPIDQLMRSIRDVAVFAWAVTGINPSLAHYMHGRPRMGSEPVDGLPAWKSDFSPSPYSPSEDMSSTAADCHELPKDGAPRPSFSRTDSPSHPYHTRHVSLDETMYDDPGGSSSSSSRRAGWPATGDFSPSCNSHRNSCCCREDRRGDDESLCRHHRDHCRAVPCSTRRRSRHQCDGSRQIDQHRRPSLRPAYSYDALRDHTRTQRQQEQQEQQQQQQQQQNLQQAQQSPPPPPPPLAAAAAAAAPPCPSEPGPSRKRRRGYSDEFWGGSDLCPSASASGSGFESEGSGLGSSSGWRTCASHGSASTSRLQGGCMSATNTSSGHVSLGGAMKATALSSRSMLDGIVGGDSTGYGGSGGLGVALGVGVGVREPIVSESAVASSSSSWGGGRGTYF